MVTKKNSKRSKVGEKGRVDVGKLKLNKETVKNLTGREAKDVKGGFGGSGPAPLRHHPIMDVPRQKIPPPATAANCPTGGCV